MSEKLQAAHIQSNTAGITQIDEIYLSWVLKLLPIAKFETSCILDYIQVTYSLNAKVHFFVPNYYLCSTI